MLFRQVQRDSSYSKVAECIKRDLAATLQKKGISITKVQINMKSGSLNVEVQIDEK